MQSCKVFDMPPDILSTQQCLHTALGQEALLTSLPQLLILATLVEKSASMVCEHLRHKSCSAVQQAADVMEAVHAAASPEEAARIGRAAQRQRPDLVRPDWDTAKLVVMETALRAKVCRGG